MKFIFPMAAAAFLCLPLVSHAQTADTASASKSSPEVAKTISAEGLPPIWLQGEPVRAFEKDKLYIFEFWATWCGPCLQAMPHMEALHQTIKERKDIAIIGVNVMDTTPSERLMGFLKSKKIAPSYAMAADDGRAGPVSQHWLTPLGIGAIPHALAVRDGVVLWRGHPNELNVSMIEALSKADFKPGSPIKDSTAELRAQREKQAQEIRTAANKNPAAALKLLDELAADGAIDDTELMAGYETVFSTQIRYDRLDQARATVQKMVAHFPENRTALLNAGHWLIDTEQLEGQDTALAIDLAERALAMHAEDVAAMELKAAALFQQGDTKAAITLQQEALESTKLRAEILALRDEISK